MSDADRPPLKLENRSEQVWVFGYLRMMPLAMVIGVIVVVMMFDVFSITPKAMAIVLLGSIVGAVILDRSTLLDPVDFVELGSLIVVKRLAARREYAPSQLVQLELRTVESSDYDDRRQHLVRLDLRLRRACRVRLLIPEHAVAALVDWATSLACPVHDLRFSTTGEHEEHHE